MEMETGKGSGGSTMLAFVLGATAGAGLALLMTPKAGHEVRGKIKELSGDAMSKSKEYAQTLQEKAKSMMEKGKSAAGQGKETVQEAGRETFGDVPEGAKEKMEEKRTSLS